MSQNARLCTQFAKKISGGNTSDQNACLAAGLRLDPLREYSPYFIFRPQMHQKRLVAGLRPDPLGEQLSSPQLPSRGGCTGREHSLAAVRSALRRERGWQYVEGAEMTEKVTFKSVIVRDFVLK